MSRPALLSLNAGSSTLKFALFEVDGGSAGRRLASGAIELPLQGQAHARWSVNGAAGAEELGVLDRRGAVEWLLARLPGWGDIELRAVGHRLVHGGGNFTAPALLDQAAIQSLSRLTPLAPLHLPAALAGIEALRAGHPSIPQVGCFDTAFHSTLPAEAWRLPLPASLAGVRRYGFHGLSCEHAVEQFGKALPRRLVIAHLGQGASLTAVFEGRSIDTTMGFTPTGGIPMGSRTGDIDPGALFEVARRTGLDLNGLEQLANHGSGLLGVGGSSDVRELLARRSTDEAARLALSMFTRAVKRTIGAQAALLGGLDALVFTGGIGEHAAELRAESCTGLGFLGIALDEESNRRHAPRIDGAGATVEVRVIPCDEERVIARHTAALVGSRGP